MSLVTLQEVLSETVEKNYAVGAFDTLNLMMTQAILNGAEEERAPIIMMYIGKMLDDKIEKECFFKCIREMINHASVPVALMLDHGLSYENCMKAIKYGFSSVMFDGSMLPYDENVEKTREIVKVAHSCGVSVEAEIGHVGGLEAEEKADINGSIVDKSGYTDPELAKRFAKDTGIDAMAIAFGTVHGKYRGVPVLDYERVKKIRESVDIPLVMHGGSGISPDDFRTAVRSGINKINICTAMITAATEEMLQEANSQNMGETNYVRLTDKGQCAITAVVQEHIKIFGTKKLVINKNKMIFD